MPEIKSYSQGMFSWADLGTTDQNAAKSFYTSILGLTVNDMPMGDGQFYSMLQKNGKDVAAIYQLDANQIQQGRPASWLAYFTAKNVDETAKKVKSLDGKVLMEPFDVFDSGRMVLAADPAGATFGAWQAKKSIGAEVMGDPGTLVWAEVMTPDPRGAASFYTRLWGIESEPFPGGSGYIILKVGKQGTAGIFPLTPEMGGMPPNWAIYFAVEDVDATAKKAREKKAKVLKEPWDVEGAGRMAFLQDPQGAMFYIMKPEPQ